MSVFGARYYTDEEIWARVEELEKERHRVRHELARPGISTDPGVLPGLARRLRELEQLGLAAEELRDCLHELQVLEDMRCEEGHGDHDLEELNQLYREYTARCEQKARVVLKLLLEQGRLAGEEEDATDVRILKFIAYAGPEYAWRLGINVGLEVAEARRRLEVLLEKGLLERVEGNMLENYHRAKNWTKHMNHTYYRITREGRHYLRRLGRQEGDGP